ncbi:MAG: SoxR reducing system RseC family protein [Pseudohongiellaceae bacterium]
MLSETARIVALEQDGAWIEARNPNVCQACSASQSCGHSLLTRLHRQRAGSIKAWSTDPARLAMLSEGDLVRVGIADDLIVRISFLVYLLPLLSMLGVAGLAQSLSANELLTISGSMVGLVLGFTIVRFLALAGVMDMGLTVLPADPAEIKNQQA